MAIGLIPLGIPVATKEQTLLKLELRQRVALPSVLSVVSRPIVHLSTKYQNTYCSIDIVSEMFYRGIKGL